MSGNSLYDPLTEEEIREDLENLDDPAFIVSNTEQGYVILGQRDEQGEVSVYAYDQSDLNDLLTALKDAYDVLIERRVSLH